MMEKNITNSGLKKSSNESSQSPSQNPSFHSAKKRRVAGGKSSTVTTSNGNLSTQEVVKPVVFLEFPIRIKPPAVQPTDLSIIPHRPHLVPANFDELWKNPTKKNYANYEQLVADAVAVTRSDGFRAQIRNSIFNDSSASSSAFSNSPASSSSEPTSPAPEEFSPSSSNDKLSTREGTPTTNSSANFNKSDALLFYTDDHPQNRRGFKYAHCKAVPDMYPALQYTAIEIPPYKARASYFDRCPQLALSEDALTVSTLHGFSSVRANVFVREGHWYYETKIVSANSSIDPPVSSSTQTLKRGGSSLGLRISSTNNNCGHVRIGLSRREASLYAPVGFDAYGYGLRDTTGETVHLSRPKQFMGEGFKTGDVIGFHIYIPKVEDYIYEIRKNIEDLDMINQYCTVSRDRIPIKYKNQLYFEILDYQPTSEMNNMIYSAPSAAKAADILERIPGSYIKVYKNGVPMGKAFENLISFMPPCSKHGKNKDLPPPVQPVSTTQASLSSHASTGTPGVNSSSQGRDSNINLQGSIPSSVQRREIFSPDDGQLGYYPTISVYKGGAAQFNFGPHFDYLPDEIAQKMRFSKCSRYGSIYPVEYLKSFKDNNLRSKKSNLSSSNDKPDGKQEEEEEEDYIIRPMCERYEEQIAEDVLYDIIDEVEFSLQSETEAKEAELENIKNSISQTVQNNKQLNNEDNNTATTNINNNNANNNDLKPVSSAGISATTQNEKIDIPLTNINVGPATTPVLDH